jgi:hypothetical protein
VLFRSQNAQGLRSPIRTAKSLRRTRPSSDRSCRATVCPGKSAPAHVSRRRTWRGTRDGSGRYAGLRAASFSIMDTSTTGRPKILSSCSTGPGSTRCCSAPASPPARASRPGWGIVTDLVRRAATAQDPGYPTAGEDAASDPEAWWAQHGDGDLGYSALLGALAPAPSARQAQLARLVS